MKHKLKLLKSEEAACNCGAKFRAYVSCKLRTEAKIHDELLDQFNHHLVSLRQGEAV